ncbi:MAG: 4-hydroxy-3-methylbut-2-enyl diphosphate reductase [Candidatus Limivivens sp.]|nr:4-hydroxy-3-methylbut-2-enyl diphosphate reductase [Candidatus Limivivens sp.]
MIVKTAKTAGFCPGVRRAVKMVYEQAALPDKQIYTYGPIIHNEQVVEDLERKGVCVLESREELEALEKGTVIIRSHGVSREIYELIRQKGLELVDATCGFVLRIHEIVWKESNAGKNILIIGNDSHPEVEGIKGWCKNGATVIETEQEAEQFVQDDGKSLCIVSQTTFNYKKFNKLVEIISKKGYDSIVLNTICNATEERQTEARAIAREADAMIVIGGRHSSNTQKLFEICKKECANTYYIQKLGDLDVQSLQSMSCVGITAGASTPNNIIEEVQNNVRNEL